MKQESRYAQALRERGFRREKFDMPRNMRRKLRAIGSPRTFIRYQEFGGDFTLANDETLQLWQADGEVDLTELGFTDNTAACRAYIRARRLH